jgi:RNA polymerase-binding transcription factor DksA
MACQKDNDMALNVEKYRKRVLEEKARLEADRQRIRDDEGIGNQVGELANLDNNHPADQGTETFEKSKDMALLAIIDAQLAQIRDALDRMDAGTYGKCERCGKDIPEARLNAVPFATLCVEDQEYIERAQ